jgi:Tol biopolymer transport system component
MVDYFDAGLLSVSENGVLAYWSPGNAESQLTWFDAQGKSLGTVGSPGAYGFVSLSPDGTQAIVSKYASDTTQRMWSLDMSRGTTTRFDLDPTDGQPVVWAPDGNSFIFSSFQVGKMSDLFQVRLTGKAAPSLLLHTNEAKDPLSWSPDGRYLLNSAMGGETNNDLWVLPMDGRNRPLPFLRTKADETDGRFSPDGRWVGYASNASGRYEILVAPFSPDALQQGISNIGPQRLVSANGGFSPMWRRDGKELFYNDLDNRLMSVPVTTGSVFQAGAPQVLFQLPRRDGDAFIPPRWSPSPDGKRFLFVAPTTQEGVPFTVVLNWQAGLKK